MALVNVVDAPAVLLFGYGSILWKQDFAYTRRLPCCVAGYRRVLYQGSSDHRGVPGKLGRVATLLPCSESWVAGVAFELPTDPTARAAILAQLDYRERGGYDRVGVTLLDIHTRKPLPLPDGAVCLCYIAAPGKSEYLGEASDEAIAAQILECAGDSGPNSEYLFKLADELRKLQAVDSHVFSVEAAALRLMGEKTEAEEEKTKAEEEKTEAEEEKTQQKTTVL